MAAPARACAYEVADCLTSIALFINTTRHARDPEIYTIISVGVALGGGLMLVIRGIGGLRESMARLQGRMDRLEAVIVPVFRRPSEGVAP